VVFKPIINGIGGNLVSVQASRISTLLHQTTPPGSIPDGQRILELPWKALFYGTPYSKAARIFLIMSVPGQVMFIFIADLIHMSSSTIGAPFVFSYITASLIQVRVEEMAIKTIN
jgi:solute carrier family 41